jgi:hypothetical protein
MQFSAADLTGNKVFLILFSLLSGLITIREKLSIFG